MNRRDLLTLLGGAAASWPVMAWGQTRVRSVGYLGTASPGPNLDQFRFGLAETGYVEGRNLAIEYRWAKGRYDKLGELATDLLGKNVELIVTQGGSEPARAVLRLTTALPIVFLTGGDPIRSGLVDNLARPRGNITGVSWFAVELVPKQLEVLWEALGARTNIGLLVNPNNDAERMVEDVQRATHEKGVLSTVFKASTEDQIADAFARASKMNVTGLVVGSDPFFGTTQREQIVNLAAQHRIPAIYNRREYTVSGGFLSYGAKEPAAYRQTGVYVGRVLKGERPSDLPVLQPTNFELVINLRTARALGITVPPTLLARADEVIE